MTSMPGFAAVSVKRKTVTYEVRGASAWELENQMSEFGPSPGGTSKRYRAMTNWLISWQFRYRNRGLDGCDMSEVWTDLKLEVVYPLWTEKSGATPALRSSWGAAMRALEAREQARSEMAIETARKIDRALTNMVAIISCERLKADANRIGNALVKELQSRNEEALRKADEIPALRD
ncbi:DUF922 domain-containing protein [Roseibium sp. M-1]